MLRLTGFWSVKQYRAGQLIHEDFVQNVVPYESQENSLRAWLDGATPGAGTILDQNVDYYIGLKGIGDPDVTDTYAGIGTTNLWDEITPYAGNRPPWNKLVVPGTPPLADNVGNEAVFTITEDITIYGTFLATLATQGGNGVLTSVVNLTSPRSALQNDVFEVVYRIITESVST